MMPLKIRTKKALVGAVVGALVGLAMGALAIVRPSVTEELELATYDVRARLAADPGRANPDIVIVDLDEESLRTAAKEMSLSWPWPREAYAVAAKYLADAGARAVIYDFVFEDEGGYGIEDTMTWAGALLETRTVIGVSLSLRAREEVESLGRWGALLARFSDEERARRAAVFALEWNTRVFAIPSGGAHELWVGGGLDEGPAYEDFERLLGDEVFRDAVLAESPETLPASDAEPVIRELTDAELGLEVTRASLYLERNALLSASAAGTVPLELRPGVNPPLALLADSAFLCGNVSQRLDTDGIMRRIALLSTSAGVILPSLSLAGAIRAAGDGNVGFPGGTFVYHGHDVPMDEAGRTLLRYHGSRNLYRHISLWDLLQSAAQLDAGEAPKIPPESLQGGIFLVSASARALKDLKPTPLDASHLGAEVVATGIDNLLAGDFIRRAHPLYNAVATFLLCLFLGTVALYIGFVYRSALAAAGVSLLVVILVVTAYSYIGFEQYRSGGLWIDLAVPALGAAMAWAVGQLANNYIESKDRRFVQDALGRYTSKALVQEVLRNPKLLSLGHGERRELSVFFSDIQGFTSISEGLEPERLVALLNDYLTPLTDLILDSGGIVDKYIGDAIMAFWGAPIPMQDHAEVSCLIALRMRDKIFELAPVWKKEFGYDVVARAGINTGPVVVGNTGSAHKFNYTVLGDTVNLAARLEGANKPYGTLLMVSEATYQAAADVVEARELDLLAVKGKTIPVRVFELLCEKGQLPEEMRAAYDVFHEGLVLYRERRFEQAVEKFRDVRARLPDDGPSKTFLERCRDASEDPPGADWDGVWRMKTK